MDGIYDEDCGVGGICGVSGSTCGWNRNFGEIRGFDNVGGIIGFLNLDMRYKICGTDC